MAFKLNNLPNRTEKPRSKGLTLVLDKGLSVRQAEDFCASSSKYSDIVKLGWGTSYVTQNLEENWQSILKLKFPYIWEVRFLRRMCCATSWTATWSF